MQTARERTDSYAENGGHIDLPPNKKTWESPVKSMFSEARNTM